MNRTLLPRSRRTAPVTLTGCSSSSGGKKAEEAANDVAVGKADIRV